ncbi:hypothetical protein F2P56_030284 [Juglans regia]|uniref:ATPase AAA-type core domain-containing protein n=1 Tax=Juglans regia TaxID=51240 RepID=A0A833TPA7_JUGRE|nr:hypothetical protein F2P56_030284 [Juglans regia]
MDGAVKTYLVEDEVRVEEFTKLVKYFVDFSQEDVDAKCSCGLFQMRAGSKKHTEDATQKLYAMIDLYSENEEPPSLTLTGSNVDCTTNETTTVGSSKQVLSPVVVRGKGRPSSLRRASRMEKEMRKVKGKTKKAPINRKRKQHIQDRLVNVIGGSQLRETFYLCVPSIPFEDSYFQLIWLLVDRNKYQIQIPLPPKIDPSVTMMTVEEKPGVTYNDVGGCKEQIEKMREVVELPMLHPEKFVKLRIDPPKGVLCYGPPGTGKTLLARAVANRTDACFIRVIGSELVQKYVGEGARMLASFTYYCKWHVQKRLVLYFLMKLTEKDFLDAVNKVIKGYQKFSVTPKYMVYN